MPKIKSILCIILCASLLSGCSFILETPANFIAPPANNDQGKHDERLLINGFLGPDERLQVPREMEHASSHVDLDLGPDRAKHKLIFWGKQNGYQVGVTLLIHTSDGWAMLDQERQSGRSVHYFKAQDIDNDGVPEIFLGVDSGGNRTLHLYKIVDDGLKHVDQINYSRLNFADINSDGQKELIVSLNNFSESPDMTDVNSYSWDENLRFQRIDRKLIEGYCHEFEYGQVSEDQQGLYMVMSSDSNALRVILLLFNDGRFEEILAQDIGFVNALTERRGGIIQDIDDDGVLNILTVRFPIDASKREPREYLQIWKAWDGDTSLVNRHAFLDNRSDGYRLQIPVPWLDQLYYSFVTEQNDRQVRFYDGEKDSGSEGSFIIHTCSYSDKERAAVRDDYIPLGSSASMDKSYYLNLESGRFDGETVDAELIRSLFTIEGGSS